MNIQNPSINDICFCDFVTLKDTVKSVKGHNKDMVYDIYNCTEKIETYGELEDAKYEVRDIDYANNKVIIFGKTKTVHPQWDKSWGCYDKYIVTEMEISVEDIDTVYSQKKGNEYLDKVWKNIVELTYLMEEKFKEIFKEEKYYRMTCGQYDTEFDPCDLIDYAMNGHEWSDFEGFNYILGAYFTNEFLTHGKFHYSTSSNGIIWNEEAFDCEYCDDDYNDITIEEYIKLQLEKLAKRLNKDYRYLLNEIETNSIRLAERDCCWSTSKATKDEIKFIADALTQYYEWMMSLITPLIKSSIDDVHNAEIDHLIQNAENDIKSYERQIENMFKMIEAKQKEIENLKTQYK